MDIRDYQAATLPPTNPEPRQIIRTFAGAMEAKLTANDHKPGWRQESWQELWRLLEGEMGELYRALEDYETERGGHGRLNTATARYRAVRLHVLRASL
nr:hypothetical protein [Ktedonobacterales bacterium]